MIYMLVKMLGVRAGLHAQIGPGKQMPAHSQEMVGGAAN